MNPRMNHMNIIINNGRKDLLTDIFDIFVVFLSNS